MLAWLTQLRHDVDTYAAGILQSAKSFSRHCNLMLSSKDSIGGCVFFPIRDHPLPESCSTKSVLLLLLPYSNKLDATEFCRPLIHASSPARFRVLLDRRLFLLNYCALPCYLLAKRHVSQDVLFYFQLRPSRRQEVMPHAVPTAGPVDWSHRY